MIHDTAENCPECKGYGNCQHCGPDLAHRCRQNEGCEGTGICFSCNGTGDRSYHDANSKIIACWEGRLTIERTEHGPVLMLDGENFAQTLLDDQVLILDRAEIDLHGNWEEGDDE